MDVNNQIIHALNEKSKYEIEIAQEGQPRIEIANVAGINSKEHPEQVIEAIQKSDIITTAIGPNIPPFIAELLAKESKLDGLQEIRKHWMLWPVKI